jgi:hypothetical protein
MAFFHGKGSRVLIHDVDLSTYFNNLDLTKELDAPETTTFGDSDREFIYGLRNATASLSGFYDGAVDAVDEELNAALGATTDRVVTVSTVGFVIGNIVYIAGKIETSYSVSSPVDGVVSITADLLANGGFERGHSFHNLTAETVTGTGASVDNGAATSNGGVANLHVTAVSGTTPSLTAKVRHSTDDAVFTDLITFTAATARTAERLSSTGTVNRYVRAEWTISGTSPSFTFMIGFARR